ncbi:MAG TPA: hypothetical protein VJH68_05150, partial [Candidatus Nanoarchaeia archaeon]|nr:hypothetical protein [Candidatus Nanoarchaeia archaeon]
MATLLDLSLISAFDVVFSWILIFAILFAILQKKGFITTNVVLNGAIASVAAFLVAFSKTAVAVINNIIPWLTVVIIFGIVLLLLFHTFGLKEEALPELVKDKGVYWTILGIAIVVVMAAFGQVFGQSLTEAAFQGGQAVDQAAEGTGTATGSFQSNVYAILFNPKVLGVIIIFV